MRPPTLMDLDDGAVPGPLTWDFVHEWMAASRPGQVLDSIVASDWNQAPWENGSGGPTSMPSSAAAKA